MEILIFIAVVIIFIFLNKDYNAKDFQHIKINRKQELQGKLEDHEAGLLIALMAKVAKADGNVCELEAQLLSHTFTDISMVFTDHENIREKLKNIYSKEKETFANTIELSKKYYNLTKRDYNKRLKVIEYLLNLAFIDGEFIRAEQMIIEDIANTLQISKNDLHNIINNFNSYYSQKESSNKMNLKNAYILLDINENSDDKTLKKQYRSLVRKHHPDIITGQGAKQSIIDEATKKLQEINEAYEIIKKDRNL